MFGTARETRHPWHSLLAICLIVLAALLELRLTGNLAF
jgi:hypothetical protein